MFANMSLILSDFDMHDVISFDTKYFFLFEALTHVHFAGIVAI